MGATVAVVGGSGYVGGELLRLLDAHPELQIGPVTGQRSAGQRVTEVHPHLAGLADRTFVATEPAQVADADLVFLALPHGQSGPFAAQLSQIAPQVKVVDLGADHRLASPDAWQRYYDTPYAGSWVYGLPELSGQRELIADATRVAATGCHAVASILALAPLIEAELASADDVAIVSVTGTSGAGRALKPHLHSSEVMGDLSAYSVGSHRHVPEIMQATGARGVSLTPVLAPLPRGILATVTARPFRSVTAAQVRDALQEAYAAEPFVHVLPEGTWPHTAATLGSNSCHLQATVDVESGRLVVVSALDNLGKGAAGQAVQCANLMLGFPETTGLPVNGVAP